MPEEKKFANSLDEFDDVLNRIRDLFITRNIQYGDAWKRKDLRDSVLHIISKTSRLESMLWVLASQAERPNDADRDDVFDLIVYGIFTVLHIEAGRTIIEPKQRESDPCQFCGSTAGFIKVHGHIQCVGCHINVEPCCEGEIATEEFPSHAD